MNIFIPKTSYIVFGKVTFTVQTGKVKLSEHV